MAHVLFMQENKFKEATGFYEPIVRKNFDSILNVSAIVLANLCVSYIMTSQNEEAEELMRKIEKEEEQVSFEYYTYSLNWLIHTHFFASSLLMKILTRKYSTYALSTLSLALCTAPKAIMNLAFQESSNRWNLTTKNLAQTLGSMPKGVSCR